MAKELSPWVRWRGFSIRAMPGHLVTAGPWRAWSDSEPHPPGETVMLIWLASSQLYFRIPHSSLSPREAFCSFFPKLSATDFYSPAPWCTPSWRCQLFIETTYSGWFPAVHWDLLQGRPNIFLKIKGGTLVLCQVQKRHSGTNDERERWQMKARWKGGREGHGTLSY